MKTRLILLGFALLMLTAFTTGVFLLVYKYPVAIAHNSFVQYVSAFLFISTPLPFLSSLIMLIFSLFKVEVLPDGSLTYDPANPYWRLMKRVWKSEWQEGISVCKACNLTSLFLFGCLAGLITVFVFGFMVWLVIQGEAPKPDWANIFHQVKLGAIIFGPMIAGVSLIQLGRKISKEAVENIGRAIIGVWVTVIPILFIINQYHVDILGAMVIYVKYFLILMGIILACFGLMYLILVLGDKTILGQWFRAWKNNFCPILNPVNKEAKS